jgi:hypothetical protein
MAKNMWNKRTIMRGIVSGMMLAAAFVFISLFLPALPWLANHFGFALPGLKGLPYRVAYAGRTYNNLETCAYAGWCQSDSQGLPPAPFCLTKEEIQRQGRWPLTQVGIIFTFLGLPHPLMMPQADVPRKLAFVAYVAYSSNCYVPYTLEGGP